MRGPLDALGRPKVTSRPAKPAPPCFVGINSYDESVTSALKALERGDATADQQRRALDWIIQIPCATYQTTFVPGAPDQSAMLQGRQFAGQMIVKQLKFTVKGVAAMGGNQVDRERR